MDTSEKAGIHESGRMDLPKNKGIWYYKDRLEDAMKEYTAKEIKLLKANPYTFKVTKNKLYFTAEFKEAF